MERRERAYARMAAWLEATEGPDAVVPVSYGPFRNVVLRYGLELCALRYAPGDPAARVLTTSVIKDNIAALRMVATNLMDAPPRAGEEGAWGILRGATRRLEEEAPEDVPGINTFSVIRLLNWVAGLGGSNARMSLDDLRFKTLALHAVDRAARPSGVAHTLRSPQHVLKFGKDGTDRDVMLVRAHAQKGQGRGFGLLERVSAVPELPRVCTVAATRAYIARTAHLVRAEPIVFNVGARGRPEARRIDAAPLFVVHDGPNRGRPLQDSTVRGYLKRIMRLAGVPKYTAQDIRVATTTALLSAGVSRDEVRSRGMWSGRFSYERSYDKIPADLDLAGHPIEPRELEPPRRLQGSARELRSAERRYRDKRQALPHSLVLRGPFFGEGRA